MIGIAIVLVTIGCAVAVENAASTVFTPRQVLYTGVHAAEAAPVHHFVGLAPSVASPSVHYVQPSLQLHSSFVHPEVHHVYDYSSSAVAVPAYVRQSYGNLLSGSPVSNGAVSTSSFTFGRSQGSGVSGQVNQASVVGSRSNSAGYSTADSTSTSSFNLGGSSQSSAQEAANAAQRKVSSSVSGSLSVPQVSVPQSSYRFGVQESSGVSSGVGSQNYASVGQQSSNIGSQINAFAGRFASPSVSQAATSVVSGSQSNDASGFQYQFGDATSQQSFSSQSSGVNSGVQFNAGATAAGRLSSDSASSGVSSTKSANTGSQAVSQQSFSSKSSVVNSDAQFNANVATHSGATTSSGSDSSVAQSVSAEASSGVSAGPSVGYQFGDSTSQQSFSSQSSDVSSGNVASRFSTPSSAPVASSAQSVYQYGSADSQQYGAYLSQPAALRIASSSQYLASPVSVRYSYPQAAVQPSPLYVHAVSQPSAPVVSAVVPHVALVRSGSQYSSGSGSSIGSSSLERSAAILSQSGEINDDGSYSYGFQSDNGIQSSASASVKSLGADDLAQVVEGSFSYTAPDGTPITTRFVADENGFHAVGDHLPTPPPIPAAIARSLEILPKLEEQEQQARPVQRPVPSVESN